MLASGPSEVLFVTYAVLVSSRSEQERFSINTTSVTITKLKRSPRKGGDGKYIFHSGYVSKMMRWFSLHIYSFFFFGLAFSFISNYYHCLGVLIFLVLLKFKYLALAHFPQYFA